MNLTRKYYPDFSIGTDAYADIPMVCEKYGTKAVIIGGKRALAAAADLIKDAVKGSKINITGVFEYGGEACREYIDELNSHQEVMDADTGYGMPKEELDKITEAFYRVDKSRSRKQGGVGLGLALCKEIVRIHKGNMEFISQEGKGTMVLITIAGGSYEKED